MKLKILYSIILIIGCSLIITNQAFSKYNVEEKILAGAIEITKEKIY